MKRTSIRQITKMITKAKANGKHEVLVRDDMLNKETFEYLQERYDVREVIWIRSYKKNFLSKPQQGRFLALSITF